MIVFFKRETAHEAAIQYNQNSFMTYFRVATRQLRSADLQEALDTIKRKNEHLDIWNNVGALKFVSILQDKRKPQIHKFKKKLYKKNCMTYIYPPPSTPSSSSPLVPTSNLPQRPGLPVENTRTVLFQSPRCCSARVMLPTASSMADTMPAYDLREWSLMKP